MKIPSPWERISSGTGDERLERQQWRGQGVWLGISVLRETDVVFVVPDSMDDKKGEWLKKNPVLRR